MWFARSWILALGYGLVQLPMLARSPQNPDGAELVAAAVSGGVLHSPGYPLQAWLDRVFVLLPLGNPALALSLLSWLAQTAAIGLLIETLRELGAGWAGRVFGAALFAFFPVTWYLGVQPERYALCSLLALACVYESVMICKMRKPSIQDAAKSGLLFSLALSQHPMLLLLAPIKGCVLERLRFSSSPRKAWLAWALAASLPALGLYLSLLLMARGVVWPNWGKIETLSDLFSLVIRRDFNGLSGLDALVLTELARIYWSSFSVLGLIQVFGWVAVWRAGGRFFALGLAASLVLSIYPILNTYASPDRLLQITYVQRYGFLPVLMMALLGGLGLHWLKLRVPAKLAPLVATVAGLAAPLFYLAGAGDADASRDRTVDEFRAALSASVPADAVYFSGTDLEMFTGIPAQAGGTRFPVFGGLKWMRERVVPLIDPRIQPAPGADTDHSLLPELTRAYAAGLEIVSTRPSLLAKIGEPRSAGILWTIRRGSKPLGADQQVQRAVALCPAIDRMSQPWPPDSHHFSIYLNSWFAFALNNAAQALASDGKMEKADLAGKISAAISGRLQIKDLGAQCLRLAQPG